MIESRYWKEELRRIARTLRPTLNPPRWTERRHCVLERDIMIGFFIVRRLIELHRVSTATRDHRLTAFSCLARGRPVTKLNLAQLWDLYEIENEKRDFKKPLYLSNQFVHAHISLVDRDASRNWSSVYVVSDFNRNQCLWRVPINEIQVLFETAASDNPMSGSFRFNPKKQDYDVSVGNDT